MTNISNILNQARETLEAERAWRRREGYPLNFFWGGQNQPTMEDALRAAPSAGSAVSRILQSELYAHFAPDNLVDESIDWHLQAFRTLGLDVSALAPTVEESDLFPTSQTRLREGRRLSPDFFRHLYVAHLAVSLVPGGPKRNRILELGAGSGKVGSLHKQIAGPSTYFICDIAETLVFAHLYLSIHHPDSRMLWVREAADLSRPDLDSFDWVFVPVMHAAAMRPDSFDLFMNFHSLGEFDNAAIRYWMRWLQGESRPAHLLVCNRYLNLMSEATHGFRLGENESSVSFDHRWRPLIWEVEPRHLRCPYIRTMQSRYLLFGAKAEEAQPPEVRRKESERAIALAQKMNVWRAFTDGPPTSFRRRMLAHDLTMSGALYHLWNAVRLDASLASLTALTQYLDAILPPSDMFVEERSYYEGRLRSLSGAAAPPASNRVPETPRRQVALLTSYRGHNLVRIAGSVVAVRQDLGPIDFTCELLGDRDLPPYLLCAEISPDGTGSTIAALKQRIDGLLGDTRPVE